MGWDMSSSVLRNLRHCEKLPEVQTQMRGTQRIACNAYNEAISRKMHASIPASWPGSYQSDHGFSQDFGLMRHQVEMSKRMIIHMFFSV